MACVKLEKIKNKCGYGYNVNIIVLVSTINYEMAVYKIVIQYQ